VSSKEEEITEAKLKKMKIKDLKAFLDARGVQCRNCGEKADFVRKALEVAARPVTNELLKPVEVKSDPIWLQWKEIGKNICEKEVPEEYRNQGYCKQFLLVVETIIEKYSKRFHKALSVEPLQLIKYSMTYPYKLAGEIILTKGLKWMVREKTKSTAKIEKRMEEPLNFWLRDCALQNVNTMNDILAERDEL